MHRGITTAVETRPAAEPARTPESCVQLPADLPHTRLLAGLLERGGDAVLIASAADRELEIVYANPAAGRLLGGAPDQIVGGGLLTRGLVGAELASRTALRLAIDTGYPYRGTAHLSRLDGSPLAANVDLSPVGEAPGRHWLAVIRETPSASGNQARPAARSVAPAAAEPTDPGDSLDLVAEGAPDLVLVWDGEDRLIATGGAAHVLLPGHAGVLRPGIRHAELMRALVERRAFDLPLASTSRFLAERAAQHRDGGGAPEQPLKGNRWLRMIEQRLPDGGAVTLWSDVSKHRWAEQALSESEDRVRAVAANAPIVLFASDRSGNLTLCEGKGLAVLKVRTDQLVGQSIRHRMRRYPDLIAAFDRAMQGQDGSVSLRVGHRRYDCWLAPSRGAGNRVTGVIGVATDVTQQQRAEAALRASEQRFQDVVRAADEVIWELTPDSRFAFISENCQSVLGLPVAALLASDPRDLIAVEARARSMRRLAVLCRRPRAFKDVELPLRLADGRQLWASISGLPTYRADGGLKSFRGVARDVTSRRQAAERLKAATVAAESANRAKSEFLANVSHELRTPLNAVIGFSEIMLSEMLGPIESAYKDYARDINTSGKHLLDLINDVLDLSKAEAGRLDLIDEMLDVEEVVEASLRFVRERADQLGVRLVTSLPAGLPHLLADERKVKQILINLLSNAVKFTESGGTVTVEAVHGVDGSLTLTVADTGIGMTAEQIPIALSTFGQVDSSLSRRYEGTGLGLPLVKALIERHGGELHIESAPNVGTRVAVRFPPERLLTAK